MPDASKTFEEFVEGPSRVAVAPREEARKDRLQLTAADLRGLTEQDPEFGRLTPRELLNRLTQQELSGPQQLRPKKLQQILVDGQIIDIPAPEAAGPQARPKLVPLSPGVQQGLSEFFREEELATPGPIRDLPIRAPRETLFIEGKNISQTPGNQILDTFRRQRQRELAQPQQPGQASLADVFGTIEI